MFKFIHTADLHLGKIFHEHSLIEDQRYMLDGLIELLAEGSYSALLIAGDVYDRSIPSPEAVSLLGDFLAALKLRRPDLAVLILPGNHDSASRLGFGKELFARLGIHLITEPEQAEEPVLVTRGDESCAFFLLPFLYPGSFSRDGEPIRSQAELAAEAAARLEGARLKALAGGADFAVLGAHLFTLGGTESDSERVFLGTAEQVPADLFKGFDYTGLGHLHRFQQAAARTWYSGSPLAYSFGEGAYEKAFLSVELERGREAGVHPIPIRPLRKLMSLRGPFSCFLEEGDGKFAEAAEAYLEVTLTGGELTENPLALLRRRFPWVLSIRQEAAMAALAGGAAPGDRIAPIPGERRDITGDFQEFLVEIYGRGDVQKTGLFRELLRELEEREAGS
jgi:exonuclease SbcD